jgi:hypothetical protein
MTMSGVLVSDERAERPHQRPDRFACFAMALPMMLKLSAITPRPTQRITLSELKARSAQEKMTVSQTAIFRFLRHLEKPTRGRTRPTERGRSA